MRKVEWENLDAFEKQTAPRAYWHLWPRLPYPRAFCPGLLTLDIEPRVFIIIHSQYLCTNSERQLIPGALQFLPSLRGYVAINSDLHGSPHALRRLLLPLSMELCFVEVVQHMWSHLRSPAVEGLVGDMKEAAR
jgi:hypothetical protein